MELWESRFEWELRERGIVVRGEDWQHFSLKDMREAFRLGYGWGVQDSGGIPPRDGEPDTP